MEGKHFTVANRFTGNNKLMEGSNFMAASKFTEEIYKMSELLIEPKPILPINRLYLLTTTVMDTQMMLHMDQEPNRLKSLELLLL